MQHEPSDFLPIRTCCLRVQKAQIGDVVPFIIRRNVTSAWRLVVYIGIKFNRRLHKQSPYREGFVCGAPPQTSSLTLGDRGVSNRG